MDSRIEKVLWSIAIPGFGQFLNGKYFKGFILVCLEFVINVNSHLNQAIVYSFQGNIPDAVNTTNFQWLMFYPCVYMFGIWDAYRDASNGSNESSSYLPFVLPAFLGTVGITYSSNFRIAGHLLGPVWLPMIFAVIGLLVGYLIQNSTS